MNDVTQQSALPARIAIVTSAGGSEHAVSLRSAENVCSALQQSFANIEIFPFDADLEDSLLAWKPDVVFPVAHGAGGESGELQALLDSMKLVYVGSDAASSALCWDKAAANTRVSEWLESTPALPADFGRCAVPPFITLRRGDDLPTAVLHFCNRLPSEGGVVVVKPAREGSSCGITFCPSTKYPLATKSEVIAGINGTLREARLDYILECIEQAFTFDSIILLQEAIVGTEITASVLEDPDARALPVIEIVTPRGEFYDYDHKYSVGGSKHIVPARLPDWVSQLAKQLAVSMHRQLGCRDLSRVDFIVSHPQHLMEKHHLWFLEINTLPGFTETSLFPDAAKAEHVLLPELVKNLVLSAWARRWPLQPGAGHMPDQPVVRQQ